MIMINRLALAAASVVIMTSSAFAHDYAELEPLAPDLRSGIVSLNWISPHFHKLSGLRPRPTVATR
jgi:hypothetical protein